jgi:hypothetical protein
LGARPPESVNFPASASIDRSRAILSESGIVSAGLVYPRIVVARGGGVPGNSPGPISWRRQSTIPVFSGIHACSAMCQAVLRCGGREVP